MCDSCRDFVKNSTSLMREACGTNFDDRDQCIMLVATMLTHALVTVRNGMLHNPDETMLNPSLWKLVEEHGKKVAEAAHSIGMRAGN